MAYAQYKVFIDWDNDAGTLVADFEASTNDWSATGGLPPGIARVTTPVQSGNYSLGITWPPYNPLQFDTPGRGFSQGRFGPDTASGSTLELSSVTRSLSSFIPGREYLITAWVYVPTGSPNVTFSVDGLGTATSTLFDTWEKLSISFTASGLEHTLAFRPSVGPSNGGTAYIDYIVLVGEDEDVTDRVLASRTPLSFQYGRDQIRSTTAIAPGQLDFEVDNQSQDYSPDNPASPIAGYLVAGRETLVTAEFNGHSYPLFRGFLDDYEIYPGPLQRSVRFTALDQMARMEAFQLSTEVFPVLRTGEAIHKILDYMNWPADMRQIDPGATTVRWWSEEGTSALEALDKLVKSEGMPSLAYINPFGVFVFEDRHHRLITDRSLNVQNTWDGENGPEPQISEPFTYNIGWKDLFNVVQINVAETKPDNTQVVWESQSTITLSAGETQSFILDLDSPVIEAIAPVAGVDYDATLGFATTALSRTTGKSISVSVTAVGGPAVVTNLSMRAKPIVTTQTYQVLMKDDVSIDRYGERVYNEDMPWASKNDVVAIAEVILGHRADRLPVIQTSMNNGTDERLTEIFERELSDRVRIIEPETFTNHDYYVESVQHTIAQAGQSHTVVYGAERVKEQVTNVFTFDDPTRGFNDGLFGISGISDPSNLLILGQTNLGEGFLGY